jgi:hypothetical protein
MGTLRFVHPTKIPDSIINSQAVIASEAQQSISPRKESMDCFARNDVEPQIQLRPRHAMRPSAVRCLPPSL